jgi:hypothetical protein
MERLPSSDLECVLNSELKCLPSSELGRLPSSEMEPLPSSELGRLCSSYKPFPLLHINANDKILHVVCREYAFAIHPAES